MKTFFLFFTWRFAWNSEWQTLNLRHSFISLSYPLLLLHCLLTHSSPNVPFLQPLKMSENLWFYVRWYRNGTLGLEWFNDTHILFLKDFIMQHRYCSFKLTILFNFTKVMKKSNLGYSLKNILAPNERAYDWYWYKRSFQWI